MLSEIARSLPSRLLRSMYVANRISPLRCASSSPSSSSSSSPPSASEASPDTVLDKVNGIINCKDYGQTFAVLHLYGSQHLLHLGDVVSIKKDVPVAVGETIKLEKCLLVGNSDFTLIGRPLLNRDLVQVEAMVIEKTMSQTHFNMFAIRRNHGFRRYRFIRYPLTMLRINKITVCHPLNSSQQSIN